MHFSRTFSKFGSKTGLLVALAFFLGTTASSFAADPKDDDYDRLDGMGKSGKRVNVIEWEGNLEIHVYPAGSLRGLALKLDKRDKDKPVMVIGYRFDNSPSVQLIRRAIVSIPMREDFRVYRDPDTGGEYDKIVITNNVLSSPLLVYSLDPAPKQLYPEGHPALNPGSAVAGEQGQNNGDRQPASTEPQIHPGVDENTGAIRSRWLR